MKWKNIKFYILAVLLLFGVFMVSTLYKPSAIDKDYKKSTILSDNHVDQFSNLELEAKSIFVYDIKEGKVLFAKNGEMQIPLASLTKAMTALVAIESSKENNMITVRQDNLELEGDSGLLVDEIWSLKNLMDFTLISSSNDGANMLASVGMFGSDDFVGKMNGFADKLGMNQTYFLNESGLDVSENIAGAYGSAKDMAILFSYILKNHHSLLEATAYEIVEINSLDMLHEVTNTNNIVNEIPSLIASKTGFTDLSGGNLVIAYEAGPMRPIVISVMGSSIDGRFSDVKKLVGASLKTMQE